MAGFADLVPQAQPALVGGGTEGTGATAGRTWLWKFDDVTDNAGDPIDLTTVTGVCKIITNLGGDTVATLDFVGGVGEFTVSLDETATGALHTGTGPRSCRWGLHLTDGTDSVQVWGPENSTFKIYPED